MTETPARRWPKTGNVGASTQLRDDEQPVTVPARPYPGEVPRTLATGGVVFPQTDGDVIPLPINRCLYEHGVPSPPPAAELRAMADDLNAHGGLDETFVAALLRQAADPLADAKRGLGIVDPPPPVTTEPITYEEIVAALEKIAPLGPQRLDVVKLAQEQIDAVTASQPHVAPSAEPWHYFGTPVELVERVEDSTPYQLQAAAGGSEGGDAPSEPAAERGHQHIWTTTSPMRCVVCRRYLTPWWRRALDRVRRPR